MSSDFRFSFSLSALGLLPLVRNCGVAAIADWFARLGALMGLVAPWLADDVTAVPLVLLLVVVGGVASTGPRGEGSAVILSPSGCG